LCQLFHHCYHEHHCVVSSLLFLSLCFSNPVLIFYIYIYIYIYIYLRFLWFCLGF
jgi:hypothetical protein